MKYAVEIVAQRGRHRLTTRIPAQSRNEAIVRNGRRVKLIQIPAA